MKLFSDEVSLLIDGLANAPDKILEYMWDHQEVSLEELQDLHDFRSKRFVESWMERMMSHLVIEQFLYPTSGKHKYALTDFAKDMIEHIRRFPGPGV